MQQCHRQGYCLLCFCVLWLATSERSGAQSNSILPTDVVPLAGPQERGLMSDSAQITLLNRLPSRFYLNASCETSFRLETNPFQYPSRYDVTQAATHGQPISSLSASQLDSLGGQLAEVNTSQQMFRALPNVTAGWALTPNIRVYGNYFAVRDRAMQTTPLNSIVQSFGGGIQKDFPLSSKLNLQADFQNRELLQSKQVPVFDYLPSVTLSYAPSPQTVAFVSGVLQLRGRKPFEGGTREIDPFYSFGVVHRRGLWTLSTFATLVQNFRQPFGSAALIPVNSYSWVLDFEAARPVSKRLPSLQAFVRAEPVFNFHSNATPGFSGNDFRLFYGLRMALGKPSLLTTHQLVRQQFEQLTKAKRSRQTHPGSKQGSPGGSPQLTPQAPQQLDQQAPLPNSQDNQQLQRSQPADQQPPEQILPSQQSPSDQNSPSPTNNQQSTTEGPSL